MASDLSTAAATPAQLAALIFNKAPREDLSRLSEPDIAMLARRAGDFLAVRAAPGAKLQITGAPGGGHVIESLNADMPFLLDSTLAEILERSIEIRLVAHPILAVERDGSGRLVQLAGAAGNPALERESYLHIHIGPLDDAALQALRDALAQVYRDVYSAVTGWKPMRERLQMAIAGYRANPPPLPAGELAEAIQFLEWMLADNFIFLGMRGYTFAGDADSADPMQGSGLGILSEPNVRVLRRGREMVMMTPEIRRFMQAPQALIITKANVKSRVHRRAHLDYVGVKLFGGAGTLDGELRVVGLFASTAYTASPRAIPYIRHKTARIIERAGYSAQSHSGKALITVLENYPRDELFQIGEDELLEQASDILAFGERPRLRVLTRADQFDRFVSAIVFVPKDRYDTSVRIRIGAYLAEAFDGKISAVYPHYPEGPLARTHYIVGRYEGETPKRAREELETAIAAIVRNWSDGLRQAAASAKAASLAAIDAQGEVFPASYRAAYPPEIALRDIGLIQRLSPEKPYAVELYRQAADAADLISLKVFSFARPMPLSERVPLLESMGFAVIEESSFDIAPLIEGGPRVWLHDMALRRANGGAADIDAIDGPVEAMLIAALRGDADIDRHNALVLEAGLDWRSAAALRALTRYARQIRAPFSIDYMAATLVKHASIAASIMALFEARFDPAREADRAEGQVKALAEIESLLGKVDVLDEDRILRLYTSLVQAMLRTNFYQRTEDGEPRPTISFKLESKKVPGMPLPAPLFEISVYSPRVEGVHLRFGKVARGGIRWSDRPEDFRTEVLGLVKAQQVKNAVIVPVGAKGGFLPKRLPPASDRQAWLAEGTEAYRIFIRSLLDITDNIIGGKIVPPAHTVRHDPDDPYLVVAADKGTATFSDIANGLSADKGHWLGDAFASGGSAGYDHKKMAITARGAWEAVKRHFREIGIDIQKQPFTVAGIGDMSGDVFGNGMLLSPAIRLVAAFDHRDIFIDPNPDPAVALRERQRLFELPRSSWQSYEAALISRGGGIFPRAAKSIPLSAEMRALLDLAGDTATPQAIMTAILKARVDLLWFGGIGTYIRASAESDPDAGDRANDSIRISADQLRCKAIGEGANLGMTQRARIEAAQAGVRLNTDAIDNSAGVNSSDMEVNIKIALAKPMTDGRLTTDTRNPLLSSMTDEVAGLVLRNNYLQSLALSLAERRAPGDLGYHRRLMQMLERGGHLDRAVEYLPADAVIEARARNGQGLTRPELAVLLAYAKLRLHDLILESPAPDEPYFARELERYFPAPVRRSYPDAIAGHRLRREIIATQLANAIVNRGGPAVMAQIMDRTGADAATLARAYAAVRDSMGLLELNSALDGLDGALGGQRQLELYAMVQDILVSRLVWFVRYLPPGKPLDESIAHYKVEISALEHARGPGKPELAAELAAAGMDKRLAARMASLDLLHDAPEIVRIAGSVQAKPQDAARVFTGLGAVLPIEQLARDAMDVRAAGHFDRLAQERAIDGIERARGRLAAEIMQDAGSDVARWSASRAGEIERIAQSLAEITQSGLSVAKLTVASGLLSDLARG